MKLHPTLTLKYDPTNDKDKQFTMYVMGQKSFLGVYYFKNLQETMKGFEIAWNVFGSTCEFYRNIQSLSETTIKGETEDV